MAGIPTESRIFADRYLRETRRLEQLHAGRLVPGAGDWTEALHGLSQRLHQVGSLIKRVAMLNKTVEYLNTLATEDIRHIGFRYYKASRTATFDFATFHADLNPVAGAESEDGLNILLHRIRCERGGVRLITNIHIAFIARHAIGRLHERQRGLHPWRATANFMLAGTLGYLTRNSEQHIESALHLLVDDVLLVGTSRPAAKRANDGVDYDNTLLEVRTALLVDEIGDHEGLEQGRIATGVVTKWLAKRSSDPKPLVETIPPLPWRGDDFTSKVAVRC